ncbi:TMV resistance protein N [Vitis vinifera]|uniref:TMV resistance protein N n=1 Tax=Vitis vinifera TaxID=29760 RepID=A0A438DTR9_VITVI|nr:TMV resistance protein N [Vitis vinifera]
MVQIALHQEPRFCHCILWSIASVGQRIGNALVLAILPTMEGNLYCSSQKTYRKGICTWVRDESDDKSEDESAHTWENETDDKSVAGSFRLLQYSEKALKVKERGVRHIYSQDLQQSHPLTIQTEDADVRICSECQQDVTCRRKRCFKGSDMNEVPIMENPLELDSLCLRDCKNLTSLPSSIFGFKSLAALSCSGCSQLESFPEIVQDMERLRKLYLDGTAIREIPSSIQRLRGLQSLFLSQCKNLVNLPESICNLTSFKTLVVSRCPNFNKLPDNLGRLQSLEHLFVGYLDSMNFQLPSLSGLCSLRILMLQACNLREFPSEIYYLSSLVMLYLGGNHFSRIPDGISQLYNLKHFDLSHCKMLQHIPELPSGLTYLDAHHCTSWKIYPANQVYSGLLYSNGVEVGAVVQTFIPESNGIPEWISHQKSEFQITMELPWSWYENDDFLGFVLCSLHVPLDTETAKHRSFNCKLNFDHDSASFLLDVIRFKQSCECCYDEDESNQGWLIYYSKSNIPKKYHSNEWRTLKASFYGHSSNKPGKVERCGFHFLSAVEDTNTDAQRSCDGAMQNIDGNGVDAQDHEMDHMHRWLELLCKFVHWICCTRR